MFTHCRLHIAVFHYKSAEKPPFGYAVHIAAFPLIWATHAGASCELLKFNFLFVAKQRSSIFYSPPLPPDLPQWNFLWTNYFRPREGRWKLPRLQKYFQHNGIFLFIFFKKKPPNWFKVAILPHKRKRISIHNSEDENIKHKTKNKIRNPSKRSVFLREYFNNIACHTTQLMGTSYTAL